MRRHVAGQEGGPTGAFRTAGCDSLRPGASCACGDRNPVPDGAERPRARRNVPGGERVSEQRRQDGLDVAPELAQVQDEGPADAAVGEQVAAGHDE